MSTRSFGKSVVFGVGASAPTPKATEIPGESVTYGFCKRQAFLKAEDYLASACTP